MDLDNIRGRAKRYCLWNSPCYEIVEKPISSEQNIIFCISTGKNQITTKHHGR